jgi:hypothetical protein
MSVVVHRNAPVIHRARAREAAHSETEEDDVSAGLPMVEHVLDINGGGSNDEVAEDDDDDDEDMRELKDKKKRLRLDLERITKLVDKAKTELSKAAEFSEERWKDLLAFTLLNRNNLTIEEWVIVSKRITHRINFFNG